MRVGARYVDTRSNNLGPKRIRSFNGWLMAGSAGGVSRALLQYAEDCDGCIIQMSGR